MSTLNKLKIGIAGLGTVGGSVFNLLQGQKHILSARSGAELQVLAWSTRSVDKALAKFSGLNLIKNYASPLEFINDVDVVVETIGGAGGAAYELAVTALKNGRHFVTANKALMSAHGAELAMLAEEKKVYLGYEAAVAGGVPVIAMLRDGLSANTITGLRGVLNGTCNFILSKMEHEGYEFTKALKEAQDLGYAEADPSFDIDGIDTAQKLSLLAALSQGLVPSIPNIPVSGIRDISLYDMQQAHEMGYTIKLLGILEQGDNNAGFYIQVEPVFVPLSSPFAALSGPLNGVQVLSSHAGAIYISGAGAGGDATASAIVSDIVGAARFGRNTGFAVPHERLMSVSALDNKTQNARFYIRMQVKDEVGVMADLATEFKNNGISIETLTQRVATGQKAGEVTLTLLTHITTRAKVLAAMDKLSDMPMTAGKPVALRLLDD